MNSTKPKRAPGRPKSSEQGSSMRETVLSAASLLFMECGYEPVSINQIAERARVTKASVYYYFSNKAQLFTESVTEMMKRIGSHTSRILRQEGDLRSRLEEVARAKMAASHVEFESLMREALPSLEKEQQEEIRRAEHGIHEVLAGFFEEAIRQGEIKSSFSPMLLAHAFSSLLAAGNRESDLAEETEGEPLSRRLVDLFWQGIGPPG
ncbi:TetR/AcrR family transcriptional regulator [Cohnella xylanilytica]|uniref:TetR/AcrR family transcriptional regulator n=1 Tax=Cohnella xylanilytica TaxID=557555 RepID=A0A841U6D3_9BACL|nr:TetR/AcrR family transcriptional regulator [Cohnella xylanilytica]MBB6695202.1 TetR/AcrR family transcriptional regulator [Cohnella xylanilytica]